MALRYTLKLLVTAAGKSFQWNIFNIQFLLRLLIIKDIDLNIFMKTKFLYDLYILHKSAKRKLDACKRYEISPESPLGVRAVLCTPKKLLTPKITLIMAEVTEVKNTGKRISVLVIGKEIHR